MEIDDLLRAQGLETERDFLLPFAHVEVALLPDDSAAPRVGGTRIGGGADAPADFDWPCCRWPLKEVADWPDHAQAMVADARAKSQVRDEDGHLVMPLSFLMQVDLGEASAFDRDHALPQRGLLLFFASIATDVEDPLFAKRVASEVRWIDCPRSALRTHAQPPTPDPFPTSALCLGLERRLHLELDWDDCQALFQRVTPPQRAFLERATSRTDALLVATLEECNGPMPPAGEVAILRLMDHAELGVYVGDASWLTFAIPRGDLEARRFESARASVFIG